MDTKIVARLKTGSIKNVVAFGEFPQRPEPPYVVVKKERDVGGRGWAFRIIGHMRPGQNIFLEDYMQGELSTLLDDFFTTTRHGNHNILLSENEISGIIANNDDGTISMERLFLMPSRVF